MLHKALLTFYRHKSKQFCYYSSFRLLQTRTEQWAVISSSASNRVCLAFLLRIAFSYLINPYNTDRTILEIELYRLQQRYTRRKNRSEAFSSEAQYVDGEYIYECPRHDPVGKRGMKERVKEVGAVEKERS